MFSKLSLKRKNSGQDQTVSDFFNILKPVDFMKKPSKKDLQNLFRHVKIARNKNVVDYPKVDNLRKMWVLGLKEYIKRESDGRHDDFRSVEEKSVDIIYDLLPMLENLSENPNYHTFRVIRMPGKVKYASYEPAKRFGTDSSGNILPQTPIDSLKLGLLPALKLQSDDIRDLNAMLSNVRGTTKHVDQTPPTKRVSPKILLIRKSTTTQAPDFTNSESITTSVTTAKEPEIRRNLIQPKLSTKLSRYGIGSTILSISLIIGLIVFSSVSFYGNQDRKIMCNSMKLQSHGLDLIDIIDMKNPNVKGWISYSSRNNPSTTYFAGKNQKELGIMGEGKYLLIKKYDGNMINVEIHEYKQNYNKVYGDYEGILTCVK